VSGKKKIEKKKKKPAGEKNLQNALFLLSKISTRSSNLSRRRHNDGRKKKNETINMQSATSSFNGVRIASSARGAGFAKKRLFLSFLFARFFFAFLCRKKSVVACTRRCAFVTATQFFCFRDSRGGTVIIVPS